MQCASQSIGFNQPSSLVSSSFPSSHTLLTNSGLLASSLTHQLSSNSSLSARRSNSSSSSSSSTSSTNSSHFDLDLEQCLDLTTKQRQGLGGNSPTKTPLTLPPPPLIMGDIPGQGPGKTMLWTIMNKSSPPSSSTNLNTTPPSSSPSSVTSSPPSQLFSSSPSSGLSVGSNPCPSNQPQSSSSSSSSYSPLSPYSFAPIHGSPHHLPVNTSLSSSPLHINLSSSSSLSLALPLPTSSSPPVSPNSFNSSNTSSNNNSNNGKYPKTSFFFHH